MKKALFLALALAAATTSTSVVATKSAAPAAAATPAAMIDCTKADSMMADAESKTPPPMTGNADNDFTVIVMDNENKTMEIMNIEAQCGKDPKKKKAAKTQGITEKQRMTVFRNMGTSL